MKENNGSGPHTSDREKGTGRSGSEKRVFDAKSKLQ